MDDGYMDFMVKLFQFCCIFEHFHNKVLKVGNTISPNLKNNTG